MKLRIKRFSTFVLFERTHEGRRHTAHASAALALHSSCTFNSIRRNEAELPSPARAREGKEADGG